MAERELSILVRANGAAAAAQQIKGVDTAVGNLGRNAGTAARNAGANIAKIGVIAGAGVALAVKGGLQDLATLESAITSVDGAITQLGLTGKISGAEVSKWANDIERNVGAAFDDKAITKAATTLLRYGKVTPANLKPAMVVMTDLAAKTGDVDSAASLLAKALAAPEKAAGKLTKSGVVLTKAQQAQIDKMVKAGNTAGAQAFLLDQLAKSTRGAALASQGPYARSLAILSDVTEDARKALAIGFVPVIEKVSDLLGKELAKPQTLDNIRKFGEGLASGLDKLIDVARGLPWTTIGDSLKLAGSGAKAVLDVFSNMPSWVQSAVITGWGLNKLTGGVAGSIIGDLGKGLIKGVLGMNAGVVNIKAGVVNGAGGVGAPGAAGGGVSKLGAFLGYVGIASIAVGVGQVIADAIGATPANPTDGASRSFYRNRPTTNVVPGSTTGQRELNLSHAAIQAMDKQRAATDKVYTSIEALRAATSTKLSDAAYASQQTAAAIRDKDFAPVINLSPRIEIKTNVSLRSFNQKAKVTTKLGFVAS